MNAVDTNILIYAHDSRDPEKQTKALHLIENLVDGVLLWQVACEYLAASRKLEPFGYSSQQAWADLNDLRSIWTTALPNWAIFEQMQVLRKRFTLSIWDGFILAACLEIKVERLYTEDFGAYPQIDGLEVINPFIPTA